MAINQADILNSLEDVCRAVDKDDFIYALLNSYGLPKSTITLLRKGDSSLNVGVGDDVGLKKKVYFRALKSDEDLEVVLEKLKTDPVTIKHDIRFLIVTDFENLLAYDTKAKDRLEVTINELPKQYAFFLPLAGYEKAIMFSEHPADVRASEKMGQLFDLIRERNDLTKAEDIHALNVFLTRLLFCFYAEDTGIFIDSQMTSAIQSFTRKDGSDVDEFFSALFTVLNLPDNSPERLSMPAHLQAFPYVNGGLFAVDEPIPEFGAKARRLLIDCGTLNWSEINPDIFGSMFQAVVDEEQRGNLGQHYTSVPNIMKVIQPLFLDGLYEDLEKARGSEKKLQTLLVRLNNISVFDVACGSGNFILIAYKELRKFEMHVIDALNEVSQQEVMYYSNIRLTQFYGIEIDDFAHEIAILSLWLAEHQMNMVFKAKFGHADAALPLSDSGNIVCGNSLRLDWEEVCPKKNGRGEDREVYICGNPPFLGDGARSPEQLKDMDTVLASFKQKRKVDYIATFFWKAAQYIKDGGSAAFVSTNSICQGAQTSILWPPIFDLGVSINFAYQSFPWTNNAKQKAAVHVVIVGLSTDSKPKAIYKEVDGQMQRTVVRNISPYLLDASNLAVKPRSRPFFNISHMVRGSQPTDGGHLFLTYDEKERLIEREPQAEKWIKQVIGASEFIKGDLRYCLWLVGATKSDIDAMPMVREKVELVRKTRLASKDKGTQKLALKPHLFREQLNPENYIVVPITTSERRSYVPIGFMDSSVVASNSVNIIPNASFYEFSILTSMLHNTWMAAVGSRMKSDYRYSNTLVYNTFPWPETTAPQRKEIEKLAENVLFAREYHTDMSLGEMYDPNKMPENLLAAHKALDLAVDKLYRDAPFRDNTERLEHLFGRYEKLVKAEKLSKKPKSKNKI